MIEYHGRPVDKHRALCMVLGYLSDDAQLIEQVKTAVWEEDVQRVANQYRPDLVHPQSLHQLLEAVSDLASMYAAMSQGGAPAAVDYVKQQLEELGPIG